MKRLNDRHRQSFTENASLESIRAALQAEEQECSRVNERIAWLEDLLDLRSQQVAAGSWPKTPATGANQTDEDLTQ